MARLRTAGLIALIIAGSTLIRSDDRLELAGPLSPVLTQWVGDAANGISKLVRIGARPAASLRLETALRATARPARAGRRRAQLAFGGATASAASLYCLFLVFLL